tara:strand:+ start:673 stop:2151 length:1479 start_codon:yes stop_codon:yes gene_type:complete
MDENSPVYENFLNQMRRFRRPVRETTRRISASKFLDKPENKTIEEIKNLTGEILETLKRQEKVEVEAFLDLQKKYEDEKRRKRENRLEKKKPVRDFLVRTGKKVTSPIFSFIERVIGAILTVFLAGPLKKLLDFLADPKNAAILERIADFFSSKFVLITGGVVALSAAISKLLITVGLLSKGLAGATIGNVLGGIFGAGGIIDRIIKSLRGKKPPGSLPKKPPKGNLLKPLMNFFKATFGAAMLFKDIGSFILLDRFKLDGMRRGGMVRGTGTGDTKIIAAESGEEMIGKTQANNFKKAFGENFFDRIRSGTDRFMNFYNRGRNVRFPNESSARMIDLIKDDFSQMTRSNKAFKAGDTSFKSLRPFKAFTPEMMGTGPTPLIRQVIERSLKAMLALGKGTAKKAPLIGTALDLAFPQPLADGTLTSAQEMQIPGTPVLKTNTPPSPVDMSGIFNQPPQFNGDDDTFINDTFSFDLPLGDPNVLEIYGADISL